jgi:Predicted Zn-dependent proteases and their inactivated homologs
LVNGIIESAGVSEKAETAELFAGSEKYHKKNVYNPELALIPVEKKIALIHQIEDDLFAYDKRVNEVESVSYEEHEGLSEFYNSRGLKLKQKSNYYVLVGAVDGKSGEEVKTSWDLSLGNDLNSFDEKSFVKGIGDKLVAKFGGVQCPSGKYPTILENDVFADLVNYFISSTSSDEVQRQSSFLIGKLNTKIASSKVNIAEKPLTKNVFFSYFDDEGVATMNKDIVKGGVLKTYLYNRETAKKDGVTSTGNGQWEGDKIGIGYGNIFVKGSKKPFADMIAPIKEGVFITEIAGLGTGMNAQSGDFSCQAQGFMIRDGKLAEPLNLITLSGNLLQMLQDVKGFDNAMKLNTDSITCADAYIKKMAIGGK